MNYAKITKCDVINGTGFRVSLFVSGCERDCPGCFNRPAHDPNYGRKFDKRAKKKIFDELNKEYCAGLSFLGGDPLSHLGDNREQVINFAKEVKEKFPDKDIWLWTGYTIDEIKNSDAMRPILDYVDFIIDGPFIQELHDREVPWRGSSNQGFFDTKQDKYL